MLRPRFDHCAWFALPLLVACAREPKPFLCPEIGLGDVVVSEIRGGDKVTGSYGQWIELYNASGEPIDPRGLRLSLRKTTGASLTGILVREEEVLVEPGDYFVLGHHRPDDVPDYVDYSFFTDFFAVEDEVGEPAIRVPADIFETGILEILACDELIDDVVYSRLPTEGTWSLAGDLEPDEATNDDDANWCNDLTEPEGPVTETGLPGTPGEANRPCVPEEPE